MSELFNPMPKDLARALAEHAQQQRFVAEEEAIRALERGLAFDDADDDIPEECPPREGALQALAALDRA